MLNKTLSVCLIVKNEEVNLPRCLKSIKGIADEIIVVDTGSTDKSKEIAKSFGAIVVDHPWNNDFSAARNASLERATKDWILFLDADEEIKEEDCNTLKIIINEESNDAKFEGYYLRLVNIIDGINVGDSIVFRAFRNRPEYRFKGRMHEQIIGSVEAFKGTNVVGSTPVKIMHYGYDPKLFNQLDKSKRNIGLLLSYEESEKDGYYYYSLGNEYCRINKYEEALETYNKAIEYKADKATGVMPIYYAYLAVALTRMLHSEKKYKKELEYIELFKKDCRDFKDIYFQEALVYIERSNFTLAKKALEEHVRCSEKKTNYTYPDNNFQQYNIPDLMNQLKNTAIKHDSNLISSIVFCREFTEGVSEGLKTLNELSKEVFILIDNSVKLDEFELENLGGKIVKGNLKDDNQLMKVMRKCRGKYIVVLDGGELISSVGQKEIINVLGTLKKDIGVVNIVTAEGKLLAKEKRIFKNGKWVKSKNSLEKLNDNKLVEETSFNIHRVHFKNKEVKSNLGNYDGLKILLATTIDNNFENIDSYLNSLKAISEEVIKIDFAIFTETKTEKLESFTEDLEEYSDKVILKEGDNSNSKAEFLEYAMENNYDYLVISDERVNLNFDKLKLLLDSEEDILTNKDIDDYSKGRIIAFNSNSLRENISFEELSLIGGRGEIFNLLIRAEAIGLKIKFDYNL